MGPTGGRLCPWTPRTGSGEDWSWLLMMWDGIPTLFIVLTLFSGTTRKYCILTRDIPSHEETQFPENPEEEVTFPRLATVAPGPPRLTVVEGICVPLHSAEVEGPFGLQGPYLGSWHKQQEFLLLLRG